METPITKKFFRKMELYIELKRQDRRARKSPPGKVIWPMEKAILLWAVGGHWHLGTPLSPKYLQDRLKERGFSENEYKDVRKVAQNLVVRGFAFHPSHESDPDTIQLTQAGFLFGEIIEETEQLWFWKIPKINKLLYWLVHMIFWVLLLGGMVFGVLELIKYFYFFIWPLFQ